MLLLCYFQIHLFDDYRWLCGSSVHIVCAVLVGKGRPSPDMSSALLFILAEFCRQDSHYAYSGFQCGCYALYQAFSALFQLCMVRNLNVPRLRTLRITSVGNHLKNRLMQDFQSRIWQGDQFIKSAQKQDLVFWWLQILLECSTNLRELSPIQGSDDARITVAPRTSGTHIARRSSGLQLKPFFVENFRRRQACAVASYLFRASRGVLGSGAPVAKPRKQKYSHPFFFKIFGRRQVRAASAQFFEPSAAVCATEPRRWNFSYVFRPPAGLCCQQAQIFESPTVGLLAMERARQSHANTKILASSAVEPAGAAGYLRRANTNDLILFFQKFRCRQANAATRLSSTRSLTRFPNGVSGRSHVIASAHQGCATRVPLSSVVVTMCTSEPLLSKFLGRQWLLLLARGFFQASVQAGPRQIFLSMTSFCPQKKGPGRLIHPLTCENHGAAQTRNIPPTDISKIFSSRGVAYNPEEIS
ncbi:hypothetical protein C8J57DRAFT_1473502 [Mycena rebaudengoi]|nr:hypothetical protein C8J57DRAFT_1473502 [Mycena rebaudengoi]